MCKVLAITNMTKVKVNRTFLNAVKSEVCKKGDKDGFGYSILSENGDIGGERTLSPEKFMPLENYDGKRLYKMPFVSVTKNVFGKLDTKNPKSFIAHGRWSTNTINLENTHPFYNGDTALIHNGVVSNAGDTELDLKTDCDTEIILRYWELGGVKAVTENVSGYYALAILEKNGLLHIVKDSTADLHMTYVRSIDSHIIATTSDIIEGLCKEMKWKYEEIESIKDNIHAVFNGTEIVSYDEIKPIGRTYGLTAKEKTALGKDDDDDSRYNNFREHYYNGAETYEKGVKTSGTTPSATEEPVPAHKERNANMVLPGVQSTTPHPNRTSGSYYKDIDDDMIPDDEYMKKFMEEDEAKEILKDMQERDALDKKRMA